MIIKNPFMLISFTVASRLALRGHGKERVMLGLWFKKTDFRKKGSSFSRAVNILA